MRTCAYVGMLGLLSCPGSVGRTAMVPFSFCGDRELLALCCFFYSSSSFLIFFLIVVRQGKDAAGCMVHKSVKAQA